MAPAVDLVGDDLLCGVGIAAGVLKVGEVEPQCLVFKDSGCIWVGLDIGFAIVTGGAGLALKGVFGILKAGKVAANTGDALLKSGNAGSRGRLPMTMDSVCDVACKYEIDLEGVDIRINKSTAGLYGSTAPNKRITLYRNAFANEEQLARTLAHERFHVHQLDSGMGYPDSYDAGNAWEQAAIAFEEAWWASQ
ncbi:hypothetical protein [Myceligenerans pegani]|uniref:DUF4157 domain-containing protein n=1 Tax=Myceligenerans pegani TaxID=2776917 RepID=A0ABR9MTU5_9MICO|nr:hypothetical protein [Myceligenerans sp. TRM 65318]MBE1874805.1 hypothetical protein [Myceligenerans sp. TRM 65318]MBE3017076.1 hypothetical protein [Myceligenerans sp. TRM 65318]